MHYPVAMSATGVERTIEAVWRIEQARIIAAIARIVRDVGLAEEFAQDALVTALAQWPGKGVPDNPAAWLMATGKRRALDHLRRNKMRDRKHGEIGYDLEIEQAHGGADVDAGEHLAELRDLVAVAGRQDDPHPPTAAVCSAVRSRTPPSARSSRTSSSAREKVLPSAVACTSTRRPAPVMTTFMSDSARESST